MYYQYSGPRVPMDSDLNTAKNLGYEYANKTFVQFTEVY